MFPPPFPPGGFPGGPGFPGPMPGMGMQIPPGMPGGGPIHVQIPPDMPEEEMDNPLLFRKTRICAVWRDGFCEWGDRCKFAHGEHELRIMPPDFMRRVEEYRNKKDKEMAEAARAGGVPSAAGDAGGAGGGGGGGAGGGGGGGGYGGGEYKDDESRKRMLRDMLKKTRVCESFMASGQCQFGQRCNFAHGYEELRPIPVPGINMQAPSGAGGGGQGGPPPGVGGPMGAPMGMPPMGMPGPMAPMGMPPFGAPGPFMPMMRGPPGAMPPIGMPGMGPASGPMGMPPMGPPQGTGLGDGGGQAAPKQQQQEVTFIDRVRAVCGLLNIGNAVAVHKEKPAALQAAVQAIKSGAAFAENPFADDVQQYINV